MSSKNITGIDLGTTFSAIAVLNSIGKPEIVPNWEGERITPSAVFFDEEDSSLVRVGIEALNSRQLNPQRCVRWIKRHMGQKDFCRKIDDRQWSAVELSGLILKKLRNDCEKNFGKVDDVVISVPAHFDEIRRKATMDAGKMAGFNVIGIINEPVAAALYYATSHDISGRIMVYDLGGGTFDVTVMDVNNKDMSIVCSQGDHALGGIDFDKKILEIFEQTYREKYNTDLITNDEELAKLEDEAEDVKKTLSRRESAKKVLYGPAGNLKIEITTEQFEKAIEPLINRTDMLIDVTLKEAGCSAADINKVLLVGGSTRLPAVVKRLEKRFGFAPDSSVNVDECVSLGAAIHAGLTKLRENPDQLDSTVSKGLSEVKLQDVCNHSYGTICAPYDEKLKQHIVKNAIILKKNTPLPCEKTQKFYTMEEGQTKLNITITQGEDSDVQFVNKIADQTFEMPPDRPPNQPIKVTYSYDLNQRMHCRFEDEKSGKKLEMDFDMSGNTLDQDKEKAKQLSGCNVQ